MGRHERPDHTTILAKEQLARDFEATITQLAQMKTPIFGWLALAGAAVALIGSFGPWAVISAPFYGSVIVGGMQCDGQFTIGLCLVSAILLLYRLKGGGKG